MSGVTSRQALTDVVGPLIEVPILVALVYVALTDVVGPLIEVPILVGLVYVALATRRHRHRRDTHPRN